MRIVGMPKLDDFAKAHGDVRGPLNAWRKEVERAEWRTTQDIRERFPSADFLAGNRVIFNIKGNHYRLVVKVRFQNGIVLIEWLGTHAEYDRKKF